MGPYYFANCVNSGKIGVPNPVTGSQPLVALNPSTPHPAALPLVMSVNPLYPFEYNQGFKNPRGALPQEINSSFTKERRPDMRGVEALVPLITPSVPFQT